MCWSASASVAMVAVGGAAMAVTWARGEPKAIWLTLAYFTVMEALQATGYAVVDQCGTPANSAITWASFLHIAFQPIVINAFAMSIAPVAVSVSLQRKIYATAAVSSGLILLHAVPVQSLGPCIPGTSLCGDQTCVMSGDWHIAWALPLNGLFSGIAYLTPFPSYFAAVFLLPLAYGAWRFVLFQAVAGPLAAALLTSNPNEMPAIWCLFSIGLILISLSGWVRHGVMAAARPVPQT